jgi:hypothetical protein
MANIWLWAGRHKSNLKRKYDRYSVVTEPVFLFSLPSNVHLVIVTNLITTISHFSHSNPFYRHIFT